MGSKKFSVRISFEKNIIQGIRLKVSDPSINEWDYEENLSMVNGLQSKLGIQMVYCLKMYLNGVRLHNGMIQGHVMRESAYYIFKDKKKKVYI